MYKELFTAVNYEWQNINELEDIRLILTDYINKPIFFISESLCVNYILKNPTDVGNNINWCRLTESNRQPTDYDSVALPIELSRHT